MLPAFEYEPTGADHIRIVIKIYHVHIGVETLSLRFEIVKDQKLSYHDNSYHNATYDFRTPTYH